MANQKATVTLDRQKVNLAKQMIRAKSISQTIDIALDRLIREAQLKHDVAAYQGKPLTAEELLTADLPVQFDLGDEDVDYDALYAPKNAPRKRR